jgi:hypothetical protein
VQRHGFSRGTGVDRRAYQEVQKTYAKSDIASGFPVQSYLRTQLVRGQKLCPTPRCTRLRKPRRGEVPTRAAVKSWGGSEDVTRMSRVTSGVLTMFSISPGLPACPTPCQSQFQSSQERKDLWGHSTPPKTRRFRQAKWLLPPLCSALPLCEPPALLAAVTRPAFTFGHFRAFRSVHLRV